MTEKLKMLKITSQIIEKLKKRLPSERDLQNI